MYLTYDVVLVTGTGNGTVPGTVVTVQYLIPGTGTVLYCTVPVFPGIFLLV